MSLAMPNIKTLLGSLRENDWYITAYSFHFLEHDYAVVFEDLRELDKGTKYFAVCLTFIDITNENRRLETYVNSYGFKESDETICEFFGIETVGNSRGTPLWGLFNSLNVATPTEYTPLEDRYRETVLNIIDRREGEEGFCCFMARHNGKNSKGEQIYRTGRNTAKTRLRRPSLFELLGDDKTISFCYRQENELDDVEIVLNLRGR